MVTPEPIGKQLGRLLSTHHVVTRRYWVTGGTALAFAVGGGLLMVYLFANPAFALGRFIAYALILTFVGIPVAVVQLARAVRSDPGATFELHEHGIAHRTRKGRRGWTWREVARLRAPNAEAAEAPPTIPLDRFVRRLGWHLGCRVRFTDGSRIRFDGYTTNGPLLARTLLERCPDALPPASAVAPVIWILAAVCPVVIAGCVTGGVLILQYLAELDDRSRLAAVTIDESTELGLTMLLLVCFVGTLGGTVVFVIVIGALIWGRK